MIAGPLTIPTGVNRMDAMSLSSMYSPVSTTRAMCPADWVQSCRVYNSIRSAFPFRFDENALVNASCSGGQIIDLDGVSAEQ